MLKTLKYSIIMFFAGMCYGVSIPFVRALYAQGFTPAETITMQYLVGAIMLALAVLSFSRKRLSLKVMAKLFGLGILAAGVSFSYYRALAVLPSATAVTLLFQFVWMGVLVQAIGERKPPKAMTLVSMIVVMFGTVFATGVLEGGTNAPLNGLGIIFGFLSAAFYTAFLVASSKVAVELPAVNRTLFASIGSFFIAFVFCPTFFAETLVPQLANTGFIFCGVGLGLVGILLPILCIAISSPHLPHGIATIMASSELPSGILCAMIFMGDAVSPLVGLGVVIVLVGIVLSQIADLRSHFKRPKSPKE